MNDQSFYDQINRQAMEQQRAMNQFMGIAQGYQPQLAQKPVQQPGTVSNDELLLLLED